MVYASAMVGIAKKNLFPTVAMLRLRSTPGLFTRNSALSYDTIATSQATAASARMEAGARLLRFLKKSRGDTIKMDMPERYAPFMV